MKKKKLKKRIKKLEETVKFLNDNYFSSYENWFEASKKYKLAMVDFDFLKSTVKTSLEEINNQIAVLRSRLDIDYTQFSTSKGPEGESNDN